MARSPRRPVPTWWRDAKLGIFIHWTPAAVPGWAPVDHEIGELMAAAGPHPLAEVPYTEWYENSLRFEGSSVWRHHRETYGDTPYRDFAAAFEAGLDQWDPADWAHRFAAAGARYVVLVAKHHDGFCLWPTAVTNPNRPHWHTRRDVVGELAEAVQREGLRFGVYYSGGLDWTFEPHPIGHAGDLLAALPGGEYPAYAEAHVRELIDRYRPAVLWGDIAWPSDRASLARLVDHYRSRVPDGVVNDRFMPRSPLNSLAARSPLVRSGIDRVGARLMASGRGIVPPAPPIYDVRTPEYTTFDDIRATPWECVRGMDRSFGYNRNSDESHFLAHDELLTMVADVTAKGGNLLLNVGPRGEDTAIPEPQLRRLDWLAEWHAGAGPALHDSRPWVRPAARTPEGVDVRFWARGERVWAVVCAADPPSTLTIPGMEPTSATTVAVVGGTTLPWTATPAGVQVTLGSWTSHPVVELSHVRAR